MKKTISLVLTLLVVLCFVAFALGSGSSSSKPSVSNDTVDVTQNGGASSSKETPKVNVGETLTTDKLKISYISGEIYTGYNEYLGPKEGNVIYRLEFAVENISNSDAIITSLSFECYADGVACDAYYGGDDDLSATLSAGRKATGAVYFEVPENAQEIEVEYETDWLNDGKAIFVVK